MKIRIAHLLQTVPVCMYLLIMMALVKASTSAPQVLHENCPTNSIADIDCFDLQRASITPGVLDSSAHQRREMQLFYDRCGYWVLERVLNRTMIATLSRDADAREFVKSPFVGRDARSFTALPIREPWRSAVSVMFQALNNSLLGLMGVDAAEVLSMELMVADAFVAGDQVRVRDRVRVRVRPVTALQWSLNLTHRPGDRPNS